MSFSVALTQVLLTLLYILPGWGLSKAKKASAGHLSTLSAVLVYICSPCLHISSFLSMDYSWEGLQNMGLFFGATLLLQSAFMSIVFLIFRKKQGDARYRILNIASVLGNVGFFGLPVMRALLPDHPEVACYSAIYCISMNILSFTMGVFCLTEEKKYMSLKTALLNPTMAGFAVALPLHILSARSFIPPVLLNAVKLVGDMSTPLCMFILGIRLAQGPIKRLFVQPFVYGASLCKLLAFPLFCYAVVRLLPLPFSFQASILILSATPCATIILSLAEMHRKGEELSANCVLVSTLLCFLTIPLLTLLV